MHSDPNSLLRRLKGRPRVQRQSGQHDKIPSLKKYMNCMVRKLVLIYELRYDKKETEHKPLNTSMSWHPNTFRGLPSMNRVSIK